MVQMKNTKIVATISDLNCSEEFIRELHEEGMNVVRLNTAHQDFEGTKRIIENVKKVSNKIPLLLDTKGPEIRTTKCSEEIELDKNQEIIMEGDCKKESSKKCIYLTHDKFVEDVEKGDKILVDDGDIELEIVCKEDNKLKCKANNSGKIKGKKSVNVPSRHMNLPALNKKDRGYIDFAIENDIDFIAHSFVRNKEDVKEIQKILDEKNSNIKIIAKIENQEGVDNIEEILDNVYGIMIARGDLGIEIDAQKIPSIQRHLIEKCIEKKKPVIVATQMLHTMIENPRPTRAEVSDVANAIYLGADAIMLSGETTYGKYPVRAVKTMRKIAEEIESEKESFDKNAVERVNTIGEFLAKSAVRASLKLPIKSIIIDTMTGRTARYLASFRGKNNIFAMTYNQRVMRQLGLSYGIYASYRETARTPDEFISDIVIPLLEQKDFEKEDLIAIVAGSFGPSHGASFIEISTFENLSKNKTKK